MLTEWKVATDDAEAAVKFRQARSQADLYRDGVLAGVELRGYRYLIVVSLKELSSSAIPADDTVSGVTYRHVNIVVDPDSPSRVARRAVK